MSTDNAHPFARETLFIAGLLAVLQRQIRQASRQIESQMESMPAGAERERLAALNLALTWPLGEIGASLGSLSHFGYIFDKSGERLSVTVSGSPVAVTPAAIGEAFALLAGIHAAREQSDGSNTWVEDSLLGDIDIKLGEWLGAEPAAALITEQRDAIADNEGDGGDEPQIDPEKAVVLIESDRDEHGSGCECGRCNGNGIAFAYSVVLERDYFRTQGGPGEVELTREYAPSEVAAATNCTLWAEEHGYTVVTISRTQQMLAEEFCECDNTHARAGTVCQFCFVRQNPTDRQALAGLIEHVSSWQE